jgi:hypothetical protein
VWVSVCLNYEVGCAEGDRQAEGGSGMGGKVG